MGDWHKAAKLITSYASRWGQILIHFDNIRGPVDIYYTVIEVNDHVNQSLDYFKYNCNLTIELKRQPAIANNGYILMICNGRYIFIMLSLIWMKLNDRRHLR